MDERNPLKSTSGRHLACGETCFFLEDELLSLEEKKRRWNSPMLTLKCRKIIFLRCLTRFMWVGPVSMLFQYKQVAQVSVTGSQRVAGGQGHACAAELMAHGEP